MTNRDSKDDDSDDVDESKNELAEIEEQYMKQVQGVGFAPEEVEYNLDEFEYDIGPNGPEDEDDFA